MGPLKPTDYGQKADTIVTYLARIPRRNCIILYLRTFTGKVSIFRLSKRRGRVGMGLIKRWFPKRTGN